MLGFPNFERHYLSYIYFILVVVAIYGVASDQVSIQLTFNEQLFLKVYCACSFMCSQFGFVIFWRKNIGTKAAPKMLVKLTPVGLREEDLEGLPRGRVLHGEG